MRREGLQTPATALRAEAQLLLTGRGLGDEVGGPEGEQEGRAPPPGSPRRSGVFVQKNQKSISSVSSLKTAAVMFVCGLVSRKDCGVQRDCIVGF